MEPEACLVQTDREQHWLRIIDAVRGSTAVQVWFRYKTEIGSGQPPGHPYANDPKSKMNACGGARPRLNSGLMANSAPMQVELEAVLKPEMRPS